MKITDKVYMLGSPKASHAYLLYTPEPVLIDTSLPFQRMNILNSLNDLNVRLMDIRHIFLTHHDADHIGNAAELAELTGATLWASAEEIPYITGEKPRHGYKKYLAKLVRRKPTGLHALPSEINDIKVISTPGHTPGHVCFLFDNVLFAGDLVKTKKGRLIPFPASSDWSYATLLDSVRKTAFASFNWVCPAHGQPIAREGQSVFGI